MRTASRKLLRLRELREERGFSQYDLAQESGVGRSTIAALETGEREAPTPPLRVRLRGRLGLRFLTSIANASPLRPRRKGQRGWWRATSGFEKT
jgi:transcriptional regulator with XRE-family HTH domain